MDLHLEQLSKRFGGTTAIEIPSLTIESGQFFTFVGPSGCGKSTLLNLIAGLDQPTTGTVRAGDRVLNDLAPRERDVSFVFQTYALYPHRTAYDNIAFPLEVAGVPRDDIDRRVKETAELLGLTDLLSRRPKQLSGGERQRVALGRAIVRKPRIFLFDEPLSNLDAPLRASMRKELKRLHAQLATTFIYVTHDQDEALSLSDQIAVLREGRVLQVAPPTRIYDHPINTFVGSFFGSPPMNIVPGILEKDGSAIQIGNRNFSLDGAIKEEFARDVLIGIRPEHVQVRSDPTTGWPGTVTFSEVHGSMTHVEVELDDARLIALVSGDCPFRPGDRVAVRVAAPHLHVFDDRGDRLTLV